MGMTSGFPTIPHALAHCSLNEAPWFSIMLVGTGHSLAAIDIRRNFQKIFLGCHNRWQFLLTIGGGSMRDHGTNGTSGNGHVEGYRVGNLLLLGSGFFLFFFFFLDFGSPKSHPSDSPIGKVVEFDPSGSLGPITITGAALQGHWFVQGKVMVPSLFVSRLQGSSRQNFGKFQSINRLLGLLHFRGCMSSALSSTRQQSLDSIGQSFNDGYWIFYRSRHFNADLGRMVAGKVSGIQFNADQLQLGCRCRGRQWRCRCPIGNSQLYKTPVVAFFSSSATFPTIHDFALM
mmetsp:Transcript_34411/g.83546  ORF Transcript_34411/g.83546 Transcript_34411/m.83546 type:complete len:288 (-) Transcript_34411:84-947(-)